MTTKDWNVLYPNLGPNYRISSEEAIDYNCAAFAVGETSNWWEPLPPNTYYWPSPLPNNLNDAYDIAEYVKAFATRGFVTCADASLEEGIEKIAIYANQWGKFEHVARQLPDGRWTSKMAIDEDIEHDSLDQLVGAHVGRPVHFMGRPIKKESEMPNNVTESQRDVSNPASASDRVIGRRTSDENPTHREDFMRLLNAAAQSRKSEG